MAKKLLLIINPNAGKGKMKASGVLLDLISEFSSGKYEVTVYPTTKQSDAEEKVAKSGLGYDLIVSYGGDGTLCETINGLIRLSKKRSSNESPESAPPFGFIPAGTANDFAATVGMPSDISQAAKKIINGKNRSIDIGQFNNKNFIYVAAFGLFTSVSYTVPQDMKKAFGHLAYVMEGVKQAIDIPSYRMTVEYNGKKIQDDFVVGLVTNSTSVAGMFKLDKSRVKLDDGMFELTLVKDPKNPVLLSRIMMDLSIQKFDPNYVIFEKVSSVKFYCEESAAWCLDGENGGVHNKAVINNMHKKAVLRI